MAGVSLIPAFHTKAHHLSATSAPIPCCANLRKPGSLPLPIGSRPPNGRTSTTWKRRKGTTVPRAAIEPEEEIWEEGSGGLAVAELGMTEVEKVKKALVEAFYGTNRGLQASSETRAEIVELITQLEAMNPTPVPTQALPLLNGKWILVYTCLSDIFSLYAMGTLPILKAEEISQTIDAESFTVENSVLFSGPLATTSFTTHAKFEVRSPKRVQLTDSIEIPENVEVLGQTIELSPFREFITPLQDAATSVARSISGSTPFKFLITIDRAESWLLTTFLDEDLCISRGDASSVFVLIKEGSSLLPPTL
ncbi:plastid-lipid-associated protein, chloroplastic isoform X2 [Amborella trichopoda]|uniref:plastid-lipid-associated protein, chloroplastic isoform X2 n=1 Tax=Amborella trichopoda TaxID=13333 RepID=UPI0009C122D1|nr:plastid-lipid-associated protein, chloroplastic isoform X2 [Amborella trichopoda]|eukprot:XP_020523054.1 plastid-lipid-associated protein, chloroplastic isoform X2 [Amborella trichopoda]